MLRKFKISLIISILYVLTSGSISIAGSVSLDGTMWMYEHESGVRHYIAFYENYHYLNSTGFGQDEPPSLWLRSKNPYLSHVNFDGSITYSATHSAPSAWSINWGRCDINDEQASFNALGMLYNIFVFNSNKPYVLVSTDWLPSPQVYSSSNENMRFASSTINSTIMFGIQF